MEIVHLHCHSHYSLMDGLCSPTELVNIAKDRGMTALAITDHGSLAGHRELQKAALEAGIKPILGVEAYISETDRFDRRAVKSRNDNTQAYNHIILLAKNQAGVINLQKLSGIAWTEGFYSKPRIDLEVLFEHKEGIIVLSGCLNGLLAKAIARDELDKAYYIANLIKSEFGSDFYVEVQSHNPPEINEALLLLADTLGIQPVMTSDCHFGTEEQRFVEEAMLVLSTKPGVNPDFNFSDASKIKNQFDRLNYTYPDRPISFAEWDLYIQTRAEAEANFVKAGIDRTDIYDNTTKITDKVEPYKYIRNAHTLPEPDGDPFEELVTLCNQGMVTRGLAGDTEAEARLAEELDVIRQKDFAAYFLVVMGMVSFAKERGILVGPGRGSAVGSLICYVLGITDINPIEYGLLFFRFITLDRNDFPDIDVDFQDSRRHEVHEYLVKKFGNVANISTYGYFKEKGVVRDAARVFRIPLSDVNRSLKGVDTFEEFEASPNTQEFRSKYPEAVHLARQLRGRIRSVGMHASGVVIANAPLWNYSAIETRVDKDNNVSGRIQVVVHDMNQAADIGLIKIDKLGLKTLSVIADALELIESRHGKKINLHDVDLSDKNVYDMLCSGYTLGVFQCEAAPYTKLLKDMQIKDFNDLVISNALVRPGAMNTVGHSLIARMHGKETKFVGHELLKPITQDSYGVIIYQEQVMQTCVKLGGLTWTEADTIRSIIGKKKDVKGFDVFKNKFVEGARKHTTKKFAEMLWHDFEAHAKYSFNKSHAVAYSMLSYWTAWLKYYYPLEFMTALLRNEKGTLQITKYLIEAKRMNLKILLPHVNYSMGNFSIEDDGIRFGIGSIKFASEGSMRILEEHRPFTSYAQLKEVCATRRSGINTRQLDAISKVGAAAFDDNPLTGHESEFYWEYLNIPKFKSIKLDSVIMDRVTLLEDYDEESVLLAVAMVTEVKRGMGWTRIGMLDETGTAGVFHGSETSIEPGQMYLFLIANNKISRYIAVDEVDERADDILIKWINNDLPEISEGQHRVISFTAQTTRAGKRIAHVVLEDHLGHLSKTMVFSGTFVKALARLMPGKVVSLEFKSLDDGTIFVKDIR